MVYSMLAMPHLVGGHVRVGIDNAGNLRRAVLAPCNAAMVTKAAHTIDELGGELATVAEARTILGLNAKE